MANTTPGSSPPALLASDATYSTVDYVDLDLPPVRIRRRRYGHADGTPRVRVEDDVDRVSIKGENEEREDAISLPHVRLVSSPPSSYLRTPEFGTSSTEGEDGQRSSAQSTTLAIFRRFDQHSLLPSGPPSSSEPPTEGCSHDISRLCMVEDRLQASVKRLERKIDELARVL